MNTQRHWRQKVRLALVDDHRLFRESLGRALAGDYDLVASLDSGDALLKCLEVRAVDVVLLDLDMPGRHGLDLIRVLRGRYPDLKVIVVSMHADRVIANAAIRAGAQGYVPKDSSVEELDRAISEVIAGRRCLSPRLSGARHRLGPLARHTGLRRLTPRQQEILLLLGEGRSAAAIARDLGVGQSTIAFHKANIVQTLGLGSNEALLSYAVLVRNGEGMDAGGGGGADEKPDPAQER